MIGQIVTDKDGNPVNGSGTKLNPSSYQPSADVIKLFAQVQEDYQIAWMLQHRTFDEFDGYSLLDRARLDQQTFAAYVGCEWVPANKKWRWKGRKNTARNKLIGILAHMLAGMLFPFVYAYNDEDEEDKMTARVMRILVEEHLKKARYEVNFLFLVTSALVNPAVFCGVEYIQAFQKVKQRLKDGKIKIIDAVDELLTGINMSVIPVDEMLISDYYSGTGQIQPLPNIIRVRRISWDEARKKYSGKHIDANGKDRFGYVQAGMTRIVIAGQDNNTLFDIDWTEADANYVQEITAYYRPEDLEAVFVGGVFMGNEEDIYNSNPFSHRRMSVIGDQYITIPVYPVAASGFEPLDPSGRFFWYKSGAFKEYWDALSQDRMYQLAQDGTFLDVIKPIFLSGVAKLDGSVMIPGATVPMPMNASVTPYQLGPNLMAALKLMDVNKEDMSESTQDKQQSGIATPGVTATAAMAAEQNARVFLGVFGVFLADLVKQIGELTMDCIIQHTTIGEIDATIPEALRLKFKKVIARGKDSGRDITNHIIFSDKYMGGEMSKKDMENAEWELFNKYGGKDTDQRVYITNPYKFARTKFSLFIDPDQIIMRSSGAYQKRKALAFSMLTDPRVAPFTDPEAVANKLVIEEFSEGDPDQFKRKGDTNGDMLSAIMGNQNGGAPAPSGVVPNLSAPVTA